MKELKPCPFCGNKDITIEKYTHSGGFGEAYRNWLIKCGVCFAEMNIPADNYYEREYYTEEEAIAMWNYRKTKKRINDMNKEYNCLVCKHFDLDNLEIDHHNAMLRFCRNDGIKLKVCPYFKLNEAKYNAKRFMEEKLNENRNNNT